MAIPLISIIIPVHNEAPNIKPLLKNLKPVAKKLKSEILFINDGSTDQTLVELRKTKNITIINLRRRYGQTAALKAGIDHAQGQIIVTMDGDGQNDPTDIPRLINKLEEGYDVVSGWRKSRQDPLSKKIISLCAEKLRKIILNDDIHDSGCTLKAYRAECFENLELYGEMHRFIPAILKNRGFTVTEISVLHHARQHGETKYNLTRTLKGFIDMLNIWFWHYYSHRPLHLFGGMGILLFTIGSLLLAISLFMRIILNIPLADRIWPMVGFFSIFSGIQFFLSGLLADISIKNYYQTTQKKNYTIKEIINT